MRSEKGRMKENVIVDKSKKFALRIIRMYRYLCDKKKEFVLSKQVLRSGTSIGANVREAERGQSKADFMAKMSIALKEADETLYWLELLHESDLLSANEFSGIYNDGQEIVRILVSITQTSKRKLYGRQ